VYTVRDTPKPLTGLDWLKSLPDGTVATAGGCDSFVKLKDGLHWIACGEVWAWSDERDWTFGIPGRTACEDNISILWTPNPEEEA